MIDAFFQINIGIMRKCEWYLGCLEASAKQFKQQNEMRIHHAR